MSHGGGPDAELGPGGRYGLRLVLLVAATVAITVPFATLTFNVVHDGPLVGWDATVADALNTWVHDRPVLVTALEVTSWLGAPPVLTVVVGLTAVWCWTDGRRRLAMFLAATAASGAVLGTLVKVLVDRPRPVVDHPVATAFGKSFPSGHAMHATIAYGAIALVVLPVLWPRARRTAVAFAVVAVAVIGSSRLLLGVHFVTDVVGGFVLGTAWLAIGAATFQTWREEVPATDGQDDRLGLEPEALEHPPAVNDPPPRGDRAAVPRRTPYRAGGDHTVTTPRR